VTKVTRTWEIGCLGLSQAHIGGSHGRSQSNAGGDNLQKKDNLLDNVNNEQKSTVEMALCNYDKCNTQKCSLRQKRFPDTQSAAKTTDTN